MAQKPTSVPKSRMSNIIDVLQGNFDFRKGKEAEPVKGYGSPELISKSERSRLLQHYENVVTPRRHAPVSANSLLSLTQGSLSRVSQTRSENRKILQLMPEVDKAARLMVASIFSPNDLARQNIKINFDIEGLPEAVKAELGKDATEFFQNKLNLKTAAPSWVYQFGYESGASVFAIVPMLSFDRLHDSNFAAQETFVNTVVDPTCQISLFGFGDQPQTTKSMNDQVALESIGAAAVLGATWDDKKVEATAASGISKELIKKIIGQESLNLTDNPSVLQLNTLHRTTNAKKTKKELTKRFRQGVPESVMSVSAEKETVTGNPILLRLPPESVTVIHTPGDPSDHQGYLVLLDVMGNPVNMLDQEQNSPLSNTNPTNIFTQVYNAHGLSSAQQTSSNTQMMEQVYSQIVAGHIKNRLNKAGYAQQSLLNSDAMYRCMFARFLEQKQTRILFLPNDLVTYMTFEIDQNGYGVSRLERIKFNLSMKMAVQISRVMAGIKSAMDKRKIDIKFTEDFMEQPEEFFQNVIREYTNKNVIAFSIDPNVIQNQIVGKAMTLKGSGIPGMEEFDITNEPDTSNSQFDFDPSILEYIDKQVLNGLRIPASTMNSLNEDDFARSVSTTNLFFSMDVSIDQDIVIAKVSDLLQKYGKYSEEFANLIYKLLPGLNPKTKSKNNSTDEANVNTTDEKDEIVLPDGMTIDDIIDGMTIALPKPNVAPSKAQFESLEAMVTAISNMMTSLFPDDIAGNDDTLRPVIALLRAKFTANNVRLYLESSGLSGFEIPDTNFADHLKGISDMDGALRNVLAMLNDKSKLEAPVDALAPEGL